jgi:molecular chaperone GrpE
MTNTFEAPGFSKDPAKEHAMPKDFKDPSNSSESADKVDDREEMIEEKDTPILPEHGLEENKVGEEAEASTVQPSVEDTLKAELLEAKDKLLRLAAEFENYKKISHREQLNAVRFANEALIHQLLPLLDSLEQAVLSCKKSADNDNNNVLIGIDMVIKQFSEILKKVGVDAFSALGQPFDPAKHEAIGEQISDDDKEGSVIAEYQKGYLLHGRLLRPARVVVAKRKEK